MLKVKNVLDSTDLRKAKQQFNKKMSKQQEEYIIPKYNHQEYFKKLNDDSKILATINNEYSSIKNQDKPEDKWYPISRMVLSERNFRSFLMKQRFVDED